MPVDVAFGQPVPPLRPYVERYIGYRMTGFAPGIHRGLPSQYLTLIVTIESTVDLAPSPDAADAADAVQSYDTLIGGLHDRSATIVHDGNQHGIQLEVTPFGSRALFGLPAGLLASTVLPLDALLGRPANELSDRVRSATTWSARFAAIDDVLRRALRDRAAPPTEVSWAWRRLVATGGTLEIGGLAREVGWSRRHLADRFTHEIGLSPKAAAKVVRFERSRQLLISPARPSLAEVAVRSGYYDQAHLNRDWRQLAGCPPTVWLAEELPSVQDELANHEAS